MLPNLFQKLTPLRLGFGNKEPEVSRITHRRLKIFNMSHIEHSQNEDRLALNENEQSSSKDFIDLNERDLTFTSEVKG